jgi:hypothetical protein
VAVDSRAFVRNGRLVLLHAPLTLDIDDRQLTRLGIDEVNTWRPVATENIRSGQDRPDHFEPGA